MKKFKILLAISYFLPVFHSFSQIPLGGKESFHLKIEEEVRFCYYNYDIPIGSTNNSASEIITANGPLIELAFNKLTVGASFLGNYAEPGTLFNKIDFDLGYEYELNNNFNIHPFAGCELNFNGAGISTGIKLNKKFYLFDYTSLGLFIGCRYSYIDDIGRNYSTIISHGYLSASLGAFVMLYDFKRPKIRKDW